MAYGLGGRGGEADESVLCMSLLPWSGLTRRPCVVSALVMYGCRRVSYGRPFVEVSVVPPVYRSVCGGVVAGLVMHIRPVVPKEACLQGPGGFWVHPHVWRQGSQRLWLMA